MYRLRSLSLVILVALAALACGRTKPLGDGNLSSLRLLPQDPVLYLGQMARLSAEARLADGTVLDVTSDPDLILRVNESDVITLLKDGWIHSVAPGQVTVLASWGGKQAKTSIRVVGGELESLSVSPETAEVDSSKSVQLKVEGKLSDGTSVDLTQAAMGTSYSSDRPAVATPTADGLVFAMNQGTATVTVQNGELFASALFIVDGGDSPLVAITLSPDAAEIQVGDSQELKLVGSYSDGSVKDLTHDPETIFSSSNESVALVDQGGLVGGLSAGRAEVTAVYRNLSSSSLITVTGTAQLVGIDVMPKKATLALGSSLQLKTMAIYDDGGQVEVTQIASYVSSSPMIVSVDQLGLAQALLPGDAEITVEYSGFSSLTGVTVLDAELVDLWFEQDEFSLQAGESRQLVLMGRFSDGSEDNLSSSSKGTVYYLEPVGVLSVSSEGLVQALTQGDAVVTARNADLQAQASISVIGQVITDFWMEPAQVSVQPGDQAAMVTWVRYSGGATADVTSETDFRSADPAVATVSQAGLVQAIAEGSTEIQASYAEWSDSSNIEVKSNTELVAINVTPDMLDLRVGRSSQLSVAALYSDGSSEDISSLTGYSSSDPSVVNVSDSGQVTAISPGDVTIDVSWGGFSDQCFVSVQPAVLEWIELLPESVTIALDGSVQFTLLGHYSDSSQRDLTAPEYGSTYESSDEAVVVVDTDGLARAMGTSGSAVVTAHNAGFMDSSTVRVQENPIPSISSVVPEQVPVGSVGATLGVQGAGFVLSSIVRVDGVDLNTSFVSDTQLGVILPGWVVQSVGRRAVSVFNGPPGGGESAAKTLLVVDTPVVSTVSPDSGLQGTSVRVGFWGSGLVGCSITTDNQRISVSNLSWHPAGLYLFATFSIAEDAPLGPVSVNLQNAAGSAMAVFTVLEGSTYPDCVVSAGQVVYMSGVQTCNNVIVDTGAVVYGTGQEPLQIIATGRVDIRGDIDVSGFAGQDGYYNPADGGTAGPGGGGGGGGGDGDLQGEPPAVGGVGSPAGDPGLGDLGRGTPSGKGGGIGAGYGVSGGCGQAGGGGGFGGDGGGGGGDSGVGTGGAGGSGNTEGSLFNGGTGGGGGSTCGPNSGGGGGGGGGVLVIATTGGDVTIEGVLSADGANGGDGFYGSGGGGGGSGGRITITSAGGNVRLEDTISVSGGIGGRSDAGDGGGGGAGGRILIDAGGGGVDDSLGYYDVNGGAEGLSRDNGFDGEAGQAGVADIQP